MQVEEKVRAQKFIIHIECQNASWCFLLCLANWTGISSGDFASVTGVCPSETVKDYKVQSQISNGHS